MAEDETELMHIEFESSDESSVEAPTTLLDGSGSRSWPALVVAVVVGGVLAALIWFSSGGESSEAPQELADEQPVVDEVDEVEEVEPEEPTDEEPDDSVIPQISNASLAIEPQRLEGFSDAVLINGELIAVAESSIADELLSPPISRSIDGVTWEQVSTTSFVDDVENSVGYSWSGIRQSGDGLTITATDFDSSRTTFVSIDGVVWDRLSIEESPAADIFFEPLLVAEEVTAGVSVSGSAVLADFVEVHTTDVDTPCFVDNRSVISCDGRRSWAFTEDTVDSVAGFDAVVACLTELSLVGPDFVLSNLDAVEPLDTAGLRVYIDQFLPTVLTDGRIVGIDERFPSSDLAACDGLANPDEIDPDPFYVFDPSSGTTQRAALPPELLGAGVTQVLGEVSASRTDLFVVRADNRLWSLNLDIAEWTEVQVILGPGDEYVLSESGDRLYSFDGRDLFVLDLTVSGRQLEVDVAVVYVPLPSSSSAPQILSATGDQVLFGLSGSAWRLDVPSGLSCAAELADAFSGDGLVVGC